MGAGMDPKQQLVFFLFFISRRRFLRLTSCMYAIGHDSSPACQMFMFVELCNLQGARVLKEVSLARACSFCTASPCRHILSTFQAVELARQIPAGHGGPWRRTVLAGRTQSGLRLFGDHGQQQLPRQGVIMDRHRQSLALVAARWWGPLHWQWRSSTRWWQHKAAVLQIGERRWRSPCSQGGVAPASWQHQLPELYN